MLTPDFVIVKRLDSKKFSKIIIFSLELGKYLIRLEPWYDSPTQGDFMNTTNIVLSAFLVLIVISNIALT